MRPPVRLRSGRPAHRQGARAVPRQVTILGLGLFGGGAGAARYFAERGARVIVSDLRPAAALAESLKALDGLPIEFRLGPASGGKEDFAGSELVVVNPAVPPESPALATAQACGARLDAEINLLLRLCPAPVAAVTGTNGKSTTVALLGEMMRQAGRKTWVGGNLGGSLLPQVEEMAAGDIVVLEVSSFQSQRLAWAGLSPHLGAVLNLTPNHLDRHRDMAEYAEAKRQLLLHQGPGDFAVLNGEDPVLRTWTDAGRGRKLFFGAEPEAPAGIRLEGETIRLWRDRRRAPLGHARGALSGVERAEIALARMRLPGAHNRFNAACAAASAWLLGAAPKAIEAALAEFPGLPDRLELVAETGGVRYYNDSIATTPESTMVALEAFREPIVLIAGGSSKNLSFEEIGRRIARRAKAVVLIGATAPEIERAIRAGAAPTPPIHPAKSLEDAVRLAHRIARPGDVVLLSPACASFDMFRNYAERGQKFREAVRGL
ncbi:MAG: UDP-N-acetylmuramoyl-L-alanine--D-glutamate ligase [Candidatus Brocadiia bacterium]